MTLDEALPIVEHRYSPARKGAKRVYQRLSDSQRELLRRRIRKAVRRNQREARIIRSMWGC